MRITECLCMVSKQYLKAASRSSGQAYCIELSETCRGRDRVEVGVGKEPPDAQMEWYGNTYVMSVKPVLPGSPMSIPNNGSSPEKALSLWVNGDFHK